MYYQSTTTIPYYCKYLRAQFGGRPTTLHTTSRQRDREKKEKKYRRLRYAVRSCQIMNEGDKEQESYLCFIFMIVRKTIDLHIC